MAKVRICSGSQSGTIVEMPQTEAEVNVAFGTAEWVIGSDVPAVVVEVEKPPEPERSKGRRNHSADKTEV